jgi:tetrahydromethanopterin S-methyltransferase subunit B
MSNESLEVRLARAEERWLTVMEDLKDSKEARKAHYQSIDAVSIQITKLDGRVANVESSLASAKPTIEEFITIKHKVAGAGAAGKWLWIGGGALLGLIASCREAIFHYFSTKGS